MKRIAFTAYGVAQPKGSAQAFIPKGWTRAIVTSDNPKNKGWQQVVAEAASAALRQQGWVIVEGEPLRLRVLFFLPRPKYIKAKTPPHVKKPDLDKLIRSVKDALTGVIWQDDSQVDEIVAQKSYAPPGWIPSAVIAVEEKETVVETVKKNVRPFPPIALQDQASAPEWTCQQCGGDLLFCGCPRG